MVNEVEPDAAPGRGGARRKADYIALTKAARARFDTLAAESIEAVFQAVLTAATQDGDMAAAKLLIDRVIPSRRGAPVSFHIRPLKTPEDCALAYADLLDESALAGSRRRKPDHLSHRCQARRAVCLGRAGGRDRSPEGAARCGRRRSAPAVADPPPVRDHLTSLENRIGWRRWAIRRADKRPTKSPLGPKKSNLDAVTRLEPCSAMTPKMSPRVPCPLREDGLPIASCNKQKGQGRTLRSAPILRPPGTLVWLRLGGSS